MLYIAPDHGSKWVYLSRQSLEATKIDIINGKIAEQGILP